MNPRQRFALSVGSLLTFGWLTLSRDWATDVEITEAGVETHTNHLLILGPAVALILATAALVRLLGDPSGLGEGKA